jgi:hypothetical protein
MLNALKNLSCSYFVNYCELLIALKDGKTSKHIFFFNKTCVVVILQNCNYLERNNSAINLISNFYEITAWH